MTYIIERSAHEILGAPSKGHKYHSVVWVDDEGQKHELFQLLLPLLCLCWLFLLRALYPIQKMRMSSC